MNFSTCLPCQVSNEFLMPLCSNQFFNDLTQSWASVTLYPTSKGMFGMLWFLCYTSPWLPRQETQNITVKVEKQSYRDTRTCRSQSRLYRFIKKISNNKYKTHTKATTLLQAPSGSVRFVTSCCVIGTSLLGALPSSAWLQLQTEIIFLLLGGKSHKDD